MVGVKEAQGSDNDISEYSHNKRALRIIRWDYRLKVISKTVVHLQTITHCYFPK